jgi:asparagine synthase (glutamine-hydrolysing)
MCRIIGHLAGGFSAGVLRAAARRQRSGGPDADYLISADGWALGANRLAIIDPVGGAQPYSLGDIHIVFNGEIYNHDELRRDLEAAGYEFADRCDGSVLPALYHRYGETFTDHLDGMYAIAVLDLRDEPTLLLTVDHAGMKPLFYHHQAGALAFASELPALLALPGVPARPRTEGLDAYLSTKAIFGADTMLVGIHVLTPGTTLVFHPGSDLRITQRPLPPPLPDEWPTLGDAASAVRDLLRQEVQRLSRADVPVAAVLSGGLDSSLVSALLAESVPDLHTFNIRYRGDWPFDEHRYAVAAGRHIGSTYHQVVADPADFPELIERVVAHLGQPNADPITVSTFALFHEIRAQGFKVALTGDGADEVFLGYRRMVNALSHDGDWPAQYRSELAAVPPGLRDKLYTPDYRDHLRRSAPAGILLDAGVSRVEAITGLEVGERLPAYHLRRVDHLSMAHGVEARLPFCQAAVQRLALSLPERLRLAGGEGKRVLRAAALDLVPDAVRNRPKQPFTLPITAMLQPGSALLSYVTDVLNPAALRRAGQLRPDAVRQVINRQTDRPNDIDAAAIWALVVYQTWWDGVTAGVSNRVATA